MTPDEQATQLATWLDQPAGAEAPEGLDADVVEAVYALRPDLAPAPRVARYLRSSSGKRTPCSASKAASSASPTGRPA